MIDEYNLFHLSPPRIIRLWTWEQQMLSYVIMRKCWCFQELSFFVKNHVRLVHCFLWKCFSKIVFFFVSHILKKIFKVTWPVIRKAKQTHAYIRFVCVFESALILLFNVHDISLTHSMPGYVLGMSVFLHIEAFCVWGAEQGPIVRLCVYCNTSGPQ